MKAETLSYFHMPELTLVGLGIFFTFFMLMLLWVFQHQRKPFYQRLEELPLAED